MARCQECLEHITGPAVPPAPGSRGRRTNLDRPSGPSDSGDNRPARFLPARSQLDRRSRGPDHAAAAPSYWSPERRVQYAEAHSCPWQ